ncbi:MAG: hypothetical protein J6N55_01765, partial [Anaerovibrio sp.]|uniref:hypothetical protein n=1 Tax=Anaerovibrio sp. TaxID=1872532 RepID=UPI001B0EE904
GELMATSCPGTNLQTLLNGGTITGKAKWYANPGKEEIVEPEPQGARSTARFNTISACPEWAQPTIRKMVEKELLAGKGVTDEKGLPADLDLSLDMLRLFVVNDRAGLY